jgi:ubiquinone/menaquinone biosynthesis C-methylase UbiE
MWHYSDETERRKWQDPEVILSDIGLKPGMTFLDVGCGDGFFALPAARIVGPAGQVFGLDSNSRGIETLRKKAEKEGLRNLTLRTARAEDVILCQACADMVFFGIVMHDFQDPQKVLKNAHQMLKMDGKLVNLDWKKIEMEFGPPVGKRFAEATASQMIESTGFSVETVKNSGEYHYVIIARPSGK